MGKAHKPRRFIGAVAPLLLAHCSLLAQVVKIEPATPTDETDLRGICSRSTQPGERLTYEWLVNGKTVSQGELSSVTTLRCESSEELKAAGARGPKAIPIVPGRHGNAAYISEDHPLVLPAEKYLDQKRGGIGFWFRPKWRGDDGLRHPLFYASGGPNGLTFVLEKEPEPHQGLIFAIREPDGKSHAVWTSGKSLKPDQWYYIACFWELQIPDSDVCRMMMFLNRSLASETPQTPDAIPPGDPPKKLIFGSSPSGGPGDVTIDEIRFFTAPPTESRLPFAPEEEGIFAESVLRCTRFNSDDVVAFKVLSGNSLVGRAEVRIGKALTERDVFGGLRSLQGTKTDAFHVEKLGKTWWVITPKGNAFFALGADHVRYTGLFCQKLGYSPYQRHVEAKYADEEGWSQSALQRLREWNFNLLTAGHSPSLRHRGLPHTEFLGLGASYAAKDDIVPKTAWTGFPNVFSSGFEEHCEKVCAARCRPSADDPWLFGYFIDNELEWYGKSQRESGLFEEAMKKPAYHSAKRALVDFLRTRYKRISDFNFVWGTHFTNFEDIASVTQPLASGNLRALEDQRAFTRLVAERYFAITTAAIRKYDPRHMILGCRFAGRAPDIWDVAGKYCDIVTLNYYGRVNLDTEEAIGLEKEFAEWHKQAGKPLMVTEWSFPALDSGLPCIHGAGQRFDTQAQKAHAFDIYQRTFFRLPFMVGSNYFMWCDEPALGISESFPEDSNYGLVNEKDEPYPELTAKARTLNAQVFDIHSGQAAHLVASLKVDKARLEVRVKNSGGSDAKTQMAITVDGQRQLHPLVVEAGKTTTLRLDVPGLGAPGGHLAACVVDPDGTLAQPGRKENRAIFVSFVKPKKEPKPLAYLVLANPTDEPLKDAPITIRLEKVLPNWATIGRPLTELCAEDLQGRPVPCQVDVISKGIPLGIPVGIPLAVSIAAEAEFSVLATIPAHACQTLALFFKSPAPKAEPPVKVQHKGTSFSVDNGLLRLERSKSGGNLVDRVFLKNIELGELRAMLWQEAEGRSYWVGPDTVEAVNVTQGPVRALIQVTASLKGPAAQRPNGLPYRCAYRLAVCPNQPFFWSQLVSIENTSPKAWTMRSYFHYATSRIGGDSRDDEPALKVPNYYIKLGVWGDEKAGAYYGVIPPAAEDCSANFWMDKGAPAQQHADARRTLDILLLPGLRYEAPEPAFLVFGVQRKGPGAAWASLTAYLRSLEKVDFQIHRPGWFW